MITAMQDSEFMSAKDKELVLRQWKTFINGGLRFKHFTDRLYKHLTLGCQFIAHYSRSGFYATYFNAAEATLLFLHQFDANYNYESVEYGGSGWILTSQYADINKAMCNAISAKLFELYTQLEARAKVEAIAKANQLVSKYGLKVVPA